MDRLKALIFQWSKLLTWGIRDITTISRSLHREARHGHDENAIHQNGPEPVHVFRCGNR